MTKRALCVGINNYPGDYNDLNGCVNDANDWAELFRGLPGFGDRITLLTDSQATKSNITIAFKDLVDQADPGDVLAFTYSGHGTWEYDQGEKDESDNRDEAICAVDDIVLDDELRDIIARLNPEARLTIILDSCHSGTGCRAGLKRTFKEDKTFAEAAPKPRYMPHREEEWISMCPLIPIRRRFLYPESGMREILLTGCNAYESSYDAYINGRYNGVLTSTAIQLIKSDPGLTYMKLYKRLRQMLPSPRFSQSPQLEGTNQNKNRPLFE